MSDEISFTIAELSAIGRLLDSEADMLLRFSRDEKQRPSVRAIAGAEADRVHDWAFRIKEIVRRDVHSIEVKGE